MCVRKSKNHSIIYYLTKKEKRNKKNDPKDDDNIDEYDVPNDAIIYDYYVLN
jgi:hypothetical protein